MCYYKYIQLTIYNNNKHPANRTYMSMLNIVSIYTKITHTFYSNDCLYILAEFINFAVCLGKFVKRDITTIKNKKKTNEEIVISCFLISYNNKRFVILRLTSNNHSLFLTMQQNKLIIKTNQVCFYTFYNFFLF